MLPGPSRLQRVGSLDAHGAQGQSGLVTMRPQLGVVIWEPGRSSPSSQHGSSKSPQVTQPLRRLPHGPRPTAPQPPPCLGVQELRRPSGPAGLAPTRLPGPPAPPLLGRGPTLDEGPGSPDVPTASSNHTHPGCGPGPLRTCWGCTQALRPPRWPAAGPGCPPPSPRPPSSLWRCGRAWCPCRCAASPRRKSRHSAVGTKPQVRGSLGKSYCSPLARK